MTRLAELFKRANAAASVQERLDRFDARIDDVAFRVAGRFCRGNVCQQISPSLSEEKLELERQRLRDSLAQ